MLQEIVVNGGRVTVTLSGRIYIEEAAILREQLLDYISQGYKYFDIDLGQVSYIDSSGLGVLVAVHKRAVQNNGAVVIKGLQGMVKELLEQTRLSQIFEVA
ncbi:MAG: STAS domain-containing protein [Syntrophomonadaceae bacterium]|jgi:anti-sigma B factor antagonist